MDILIVDDHPLTCAGLKILLETNYQDAHIDIAHCAHDAKAKLESNGMPDWLFLDIRLPDDPESRLFEWLRETGGIIRTIIISAEVTEEKLRYMLESGVHGFISKSAEPEVLLSGFSAIQRGEVYLPPKYQTQDMFGIKASLRNPLTARQKEVYRLLLKGYSNKLIAHELNLSEHTVKEYVSAILAAYKVKDRLELILKSPLYTPAG